MMNHPVHLILSPGTRIVTRNPANRIGGGGLIPTGAVAVIIESPPDALHAYKVRFNDGFEAMLRRSEFSILKEFKGEGIETTASGIDFDDWKPFIIYRSACRGKSKPDFIAKLGTVEEEADESGWANEFLLKARREMEE